MQKENTISDDTLTILLYNLRSSLRHANDRVRDQRRINNITRFTETQINPSDFTSKVIKTHIFFKINFNNNNNN